MGTDTRVFLLVALLALPACSTAKGPTKADPVQAQPVSANTYPAEILGQWEPGPNLCNLPLTYDSDAGFKIAPKLLQGYEHTNTPKRVQVISQSPQAWRIEAIEQHDGEQDDVVDIFVLSGSDYLTVTDGQRSTTYRKCH